MEVESPLRIASAARREVSCDPNPAKELGSRTPVRTTTLVPNAWPGKQGQDGGGALDSDSPSLADLAKDPTIAAELRRTPRASRASKSCGVVLDTWSGWQPHPNVSQVPETLCWGVEAGTSRRPGCLERVRHRVPGHVPYGAMLPKPCRSRSVTRCRRGLRNAGNHVKAPQIWYRRSSPT